MLYGPGNINKHDLKEHDALIVIPRMQTPSHFPIYYSLLIILFIHSVKFHAYRFCYIHLELPFSQNLNFFTHPSMLVVFDWK